MNDSAPLVSIGIPVYNGAERLEATVRSVLAQDYPDIELVISDNASTDGTQALCRRLAAEDERIVYHRQPRNIGIVGNFTTVLKLAKGTYFRWTGDDQWLAPDYVSRCLRVFAEDPRLILVSTQIAYRNEEGGIETAPYEGTAFLSDDPADRFAEMLRLLNESHLVIDPLYSMLRREPVLAIRRRLLAREDQVFATQLALAGPWGHVPEVLAARDWEPASTSTLTRKLGLPAWQAWFANIVQCYGTLRGLGDVELTPEQRRRSRRAVGRMYLRRHRRTFEHRSRKLLALISG